MSYDIGVTPMMGIAGSDLSTKQFQAVSWNTSGQLAITADAAAADGILLNTPGSGQASAVATVPGQITRAKAGGAITAGDLLEVASGKLVTKSSGKVVAKALAAATADGDIIPVLLMLDR